MIVKYSLACHFMGVSIYRPLLQIGMATDDHPLQEADQTNLVVLKKS